MRFVIKMSSSEDEQNTEASGSIIDCDKPSNSSSSWVVSDCQISTPSQSHHEKINEIDTIDMEKEEKIDFVPFRYALEFLPKEFDGHNMSVLKFIKNCRFAAESIVPHQRSHLFKIIRSRIVGDAEVCLQNHEITNLEELMNHLKFNYTDHKNLGQLNSMLATVAQCENESVIKYGGKISEILSEIIELIKEKNDAISANALINSIKEVATENFLVGLNRDLALRVRLGRPKNLSEAIKIAKEAEWELNFEKTLQREKDQGKQEVTGNFRISEKYSKSQYNTRIASRENPNVRLIEKGSASDKKRFNHENYKFKKEIVEPPRKLIKQEQTGIRKELRCYACGEIGHIRGNCKDGRKCYRCGEKGHLKAECSIKICYHCNQTGHLKRDCPEIDNNKTSKIECTKCKGFGHSTDKCWGACTYCKKMGHKYENCWSRQNKIKYEKEVKLEESKNQL